MLKIWPKIWDSLSTCVLPPFGNYNKNGSKLSKFVLIKIIWFHYIKIQDICNQAKCYQFSWVFGIPSKYENKWSSQNWKTWGKNPEIFLQIGIIFVKKASSILFSENFHDTWYLFKILSFWRIQIKDSKLCLFVEKIRELRSKLPI